MTRRLSPEQVAVLACEQPTAPVLVSRVHAEACRYGHTGRCTCLPGLRAESLTGESIARAVNGMRAWQRRHVS